MCNNKGMTLIESLVAFEIYVSIIILILGLYMHALEKNNQTKMIYQKLQKEEKISYTENFQSLMEEVLHS